MPPPPSSADIFYGWPLSAAGNQSGARDIGFHSFGYGARRRLSTINHSYATADHRSIEMMETLDGLPPKHR